MTKRIHSKIVSNDFIRKIKSQSISSISQRISKEQKIYVMILWHHKKWYQTISDQHGYPVRIFAVFVFWHLYKANKQRKPCINSKVKKPRVSQIHVNWFIKDMSVAIGKIMVWTGIDSQDNITISWMKNGLIKVVLTFNCVIVVLWKSWMLS